MEQGSRNRRSFTTHFNRQPWEIKLADLRSASQGPFYLEISLPDDEMAKHLIEAIAEQLD